MFSTLYFGFQFHRQLLISIWLSVVICNLRTFCAILRGFLFGELTELQSCQQLSYCCPLLGMRTWAPGTSPTGRVCVLAECGWANIWLVGSFDCVKCLSHSFYRTNMSLPREDVIDWCGHMFVYPFSYFIFETLIELFTLSTILMLCLGFPKSVWVMWSCTWLTSSFNPEQQGCWLGM